MKRSFTSALVAGRYSSALMRKSVSTAKANASALTEALATKRSSLFARMKLRWTTSANSTREKDIALLVKLSERCRDLEHLKFYEKHKVHELSAEIRNHIAELFLEHDGSLEANNKVKLIHSKYHGITHLHVTTACFSDIFAFVIEGKRAL